MVCGNIAVIENLDITPDGFVNLQVKILLNRQM